MRTLDVYLGEKLIGNITENRKGGRFEYSADVVARLAGRPVLSLSFPAKARPFGEEKTSNWFNGLLPEGNRRVLTNAQTMFRLRSCAKIRLLHK